MSASRSLLRRLSWWFAAALLLLYGTGAVLGWLYAARTARQFALLTLKSEVETLAAYVRESGRLDAPELTGEEELPLPLWLRVLRDGRVLAAAPGTPAVESIEPRRPDDVVSVSFRRGTPPYLVVRHLVGASQPGVVVEGIGDLTPLERRERRLAGGLALAGLVLIPLAALGGRLLAARALAPVEGLVQAIDRLGPERLDGRLPLPPDAVAEVAVLAGAFNALLARLEESVETMRRFTADASHEIRNPLTVLRSGLEIALRRERSPREYQALLRENLEEVERLHHVVEGLLALARAEPGTPYPLQRERVDLARLVEAALAGFELLAAERSVTFATELAPVSVTGDAALLRLVAFNLIDNALKHGPAGRPLRIALSEAADRVQLVVADEGPGVPETARARLFDRFFRADPQRPGTGGLGLSVVRWVAELHGGSVRLLDEEPGVAFVVDLPRGDTTR